MTSDGVYILADHCNTVYMPQEGYGDIGQNIADNKPRVMGVNDRNEFVDRVAEIHDEGLTERESDGLGYILAYESPAGLEEVLTEGVEAQHPEDYGEGFIHLCDRDYEVDIVTAGIEDVARRTMSQRMNGSMPNVIGTRLNQNHEGMEVDFYCAGEQKLEALKQRYGVDHLSEFNTVALGNSDSNDGPMMEEAVVGIGRGSAYDSADLYTEEDQDFWTRGTLVAISSAILEGENPRNAGLDFIERAENPQLEEAELGGNSGDTAIEILDVYEQVKAEVQ